MATVFHLSHDWVCPTVPSRYPDYEFISDNSISWSAGLHNRYTENSLRGVILDIHFLSQTDFLVCTFSSQVWNLHRSLHFHMFSHKTEAWVWCCDESSLSKHGEPSGILMCVYSLTRNQRSDFSLTGGCSKSNIFAFLGNMFISISI